MRVLHEITAHPLFYALLPVICALAAFAGLAVGMVLLYVPARRSVIRAHVHGLAAELASLVDAELSAQELLSRLEPEQLAEQIEAPLRKLADEATVELMQRHKPDMWELLPVRIKHTIIERARTRAPALAARILGAIQVDAGDVLDLRSLVDRVLTEDPKLLSDITRQLNAPILGAVTARATAIGLVVGLVAIPVGALAAPVAYVAPLVGCVGGRWLAALPLRADLRRHRTRFARTLANRMAEVITFHTVVTELVTGPRSDRVRRLARRAVTLAVDEQAGLAKPFLSTVLGATTFQHLKHGAAEKAMISAPVLAEQLDEYAGRAMQVRAALSYRLRRAEPGRLEPIPRGALRFGRVRGYVCAGVFGVLGGVLTLVLAMATVGVS